MVPVWYLMKIHIMAEHSDITNIEAKLHYIPQNNILNSTFNSTDEDQETPDATSKDKITNYFPRDFRRTSWYEPMQLCYSFSYFDVNERTCIHLTK